ncbi:universal stress protein [Streptomyces sp. NPDC001185]|uniref:universal stress protein n=1 Tax=Streptomyces sp. NPDC001185 TaxID=3154380 RepID=UPI00331C9928
MARTKAPLVLVRADERAEEESPRGDVVLGLDLQLPDDTVIGFAFDAAARRGGSLRVVHGWSLPPYYGYGGALDAGLNSELDAQAQRGLAEALRPWQGKFPGVEAHGQVVVGSAASHLVDASRDAALVVVGRRSRRSHAGPHVGPVAQAVLHHAMAPVAVVPHD